MEREKYGEFFKQNQEIKVLMSTRVWDGDSIDGIESLQEEDNRATYIVEQMLHKISKNFHMMNA